MRSLLIISLLSFFIAVGVMLASSSARQPAGTAQIPLGQVSPVKQTVVGFATVVTVLAGLGLWLRRTKRRVARADGDTSSATGAPSVPELPWSVRLAGGLPPVHAVWSLTVLAELEWHRFQQVVVAYERELGNEARLAGFGTEDGIDARVSDLRSGQTQRLIQCRALDLQQVDAGPVVELHEAMIAEEVPQGTFYTTSEFTREARAFARGRGIDLVDNREFLRRIGRLPVEAQHRLFDLAVAGDYRTPTCPECGIKLEMDDRPSRPKVWRCRNRPRCDWTLRPVRR